MVVIRKMQMKTMMRSECPMLGWVQGARMDRDAAPGKHLKIDGRGLLHPLGRWKRGGAKNYS